MNTDIQAFNARQNAAEALICNMLAQAIDTGLPEAESKIWHAQPVWFLDGNPVVGYSTHKDGIRLLFWSGQTFETDKLKPIGKFKSAEMRYSEAAQIDLADLTQWLHQSRDVQWDYKNIVKRKGQLLRLR